MFSTLDLRKCLIYETFYLVIEILRACEKELKEFPGVHELRFRDRSGIYRVVYWIRRQNEIWLVHAFKKKTQQAPNQNIEVAKQRIKRIL